MHNTVQDDRLQVSTATLLAKILQDPNLPVLPATALEVLDKASRPDTTIAEIGAIISRDPALVGKILKTINSALFGLPRSVSSIERSLQFLGLKPVRALILSFSMSIMYRSANPSAGLVNFWKTSLAGAMIARELAKRLGRPEVDDDFTAALLRDVGMLILDQVASAQYAAILATPAEDLAVRQCEIERELLGVDHAEVGAHVLQQWRMPEDITNAIRFHHSWEETTNRGTPDAADRALLLHFASLAAQMLVTPKSARIREELFKVARDRYQLDETGLIEFLTPLNRKIEEFAQNLNVAIGPTQQFPEILMQATEELARIAVETGAENARIRQENRDIERQAQQWRRTAYRLRRQVMHDALTGVCNRGYFEEYLVTEFKRANRRCSVLGLVFLDLDGFKKINDELGHPFGDQVLKEVAQSLKRTVRGGDVVARYGGDEFCVIVSDTSESALQGLSERLLSAIQSLVTRRGGKEGRVGASIGGVVCLPHRAKHTYDDFLAAADKAMYAAKTAGKNQVTLVSLLEESDIDLLQEIERRLISKYMQETGAATEDQIREALRLSPTSPYCIGRLARQMAWISPRKLKRALAEQRASKRMFGEVAVEHGWLTQTQVYGLLAMQRQRPEDLVDGLIEIEALDEAQGRERLKGYFKTLAKMC